eukprot:TRINITY_DN32862_c0_g1_i2.p1 TRINITY_DN32862_c0_g1~~TRINITY_DN32862_c0_g1_i2.p1  ORF type:complete len:258 (+),score=59.60 TRINITY_DN32862_c0_g1_i2:41-814(+)
MPGIRCGGACSTLSCVLLGVFCSAVWGAEGGRPGYGEYCARPGDYRKMNATDWVEQPWCEKGSVQNPESYTGGGDDYLSEYQVVDLSSPEYDEKFCCHSNYTALIPRNTTVEYLDAKAQKYHEAVQRLLSRYNCDDFYPYMNCTPCDYAYRSWVCSIMFPRKCRDSPDSRILGHTQKVCKDVCFEVVRKCPVELDFHCPTDASYGDWGSEDEWRTQEFGPFVGRCNPMQYNVEEGAAGLSPATLIVLLGALAAAVAA